MKRKAIFFALAVSVFFGAFLSNTPRVSATAKAPRALATTLTVDRTDDTSAAMACTAAPNDCSLRGAIRSSNASASSTEVIIQLQAATTYNLTLSNSTQENASATGDLDIAATNHAVTITGGGFEGANATTISAAGINGSTSRHRVFHITGGANAVTFTDLIIADGRAADDGTGGVSTVSGSQTTIGIGGGILNSGGNVTLTNVLVRNCRAIGKGDHLINEHTTLEARRRRTRERVADGHGDSFRQQVFG